MHLTTEAGDPVAPVLFEEDSLGLAPNIVLPEPLPDEDDSGDDPLRTYLREIHEVNLLTAADERMLACRMEEMICLDEVRAELAGAEGGEPSGTAVAVRLYERFYERRDPRAGAERDGAHRGRLRAAPGAARSPATRLRTRP